MDYFHLSTSLDFYRSNVNRQQRCIGFECNSQVLLQLVDFECWKTVIARSEKSSGAISNEGAVCILPNSMEGRHLDIQGNVYAFGVLLLEIISGRPSYSRDKGSLVDWVRRLL